MGTPATTTWKPASTTSTNRSNRTDTMPGDTTGEKMKEGMTKTGDGIKHAGEKTGEGIKHAYEKTVEGMKHAGDKTSDAFHKMVGKEPKKHGDEAPQEAEKK